MCLVAFTTQVSLDRNCPFGAFLLISNRDEVISRASEPLHHWGDEFGILAGKDLQFGGTWLGINRSGLIAALTNQIEISSEDSIDSTSHQYKVHVSFTSRGHLVHHCLDRNKSDHLSAQGMVDEAIEQLISPILPKYYRGFSLLVGHVVHNALISPNLKLLYHPPNQNRLPLHESWSKLNWEQPGQIYAISNGNPYELDWPKVERVKYLLKNSLEKILSNESKTKYQNEFWRECFLKSILSDKEVGEFKYSYKHPMHPEKIDHMISIFVPFNSSHLQDEKEYGTVSSTIVMVGHSKQGMKVKCIEYDWIKYRSICKQQNRSFHILYDDIFPYIEQVHTMIIPT